MIDPIVVGKVKQSATRIISGDKVYLYGFASPEARTKYICDCSVGRVEMIPKGGFLEIVAEATVDETCIDNVVPLKIAGLSSSKAISVRDTRGDFKNFCDIVFYDQDCVVVPRGTDSAAYMSSPDSTSYCAIRGARFPYIIPVSEYSQKYSKMADSKRLSNECPFLVHNPHYEVMAVSPSDGLMAFDAFDYYHYGVDGFNDIGWGCAYRSIQTMLSWFHFNFPHLVSAPGVLSIPEIQARLQAIDHAHSHLKIGSSTWIGCVEAGGVLGDQTKGRIECRILHATSIDELEAHLLESVRSHFISFGSPVMVGAGDYAFVVAGVSLASKQVLILDPHCQQSANGLAVKKGFVAWKSIRKQFGFKKTNASGGFINICLPLPPPIRDYDC